MAASAVQPDALTHQAAGPNEARRKPCANRVTAALQTQKMLAEHGVRRRRSHPCGDVVLLGRKGAQPQTAGAAAVAGATTGGADPRLAPAKMAEDTVDVAAWCGPSLVVRVVFAGAGSLVYHVSFLLGGSLMQKRPRFRRTPRSRRCCDGNGGNRCDRCHRAMDCCCTGDARRTMWGIERQARWRSG